MKSYSLTRRLIGAVLLVELCSTLVLVAGAGLYEGVSRFRAFDVMLRGRAYSMLGAVQDAEDPEDNVMLDGSQTTAPRRDIYAVRDEFGRMLGQSRNWPDAWLAFDTAAEFRSVNVGGRRYRVIRVAGHRTVDAEDKGGGITRHVIVFYGSRTHPIWESIGHAIAFYAVLSLVLLGLSGLMMLRVLQRGLKPLRELEGQAARVSVDSWQFQPSERVREVRELAPLASALEIALAGLERSFEQQKQFVGDAAHELKTSVSVVKSSLQLLMMKNRNVEEYRAGLTRAEQDCERMEELVASMLTLAGLEAGGDGRTVGPVELGDVVWEIAEQFRAAAEMAEVRIAVRGEKEAWVLGERERVRLLCSNLIHNAVQHSASGGEVRVLLSTEGGRAELRIEDDGDGIAPEALPHVFERFFRGDPSRSRRTGGTGLGLAISKAVVQGMRGRIRIESELGRGTRVVVEFPSAPRVHLPERTHVRESSALLKVNLS